MLTVTILGCNMYKYIVALVFKAHAWEQFLSSHLKLCTKKTFSCHVTLCSPPPPRPQACLVYFNISSVQKGQRLGRISASDTLRIKPVLAPAITFASLHSSCDRSCEPIFVMWPQAHKSSRIIGPPSVFLPASEARVRDEASGPR